MNNPTCISRILQPLSPFDRRMIASDILFHAAIYVRWSVEIKRADQRIPGERVYSVPMLIAANELMQLSRGVLHG